MLSRDQGHASKRLSSCTEFNNLKFHEIIDAIEEDDSMLVRFLSHIEIHYYTRNSSGDEIANVNFLYDDIVHAVKIQ